MGSVVVSTLVGDILIITGGNGSWSQTSSRNIQDLVSEHSSQHPPFDWIMVFCLLHKIPFLFYRAQLLEQGKE